MTFKGPKQWFKDWKTNKVTDKNACSDYGFSVRMDWLSKEPETSVQQSPKDVLSCSKPDILVRERLPTPKPVRILETSFNIYDEIKDNPNSEPLPPRLPICSGNLLGVRGQRARLNNAIEVGPYLIVPLVDTVESQPRFEIVQSRSDRERFHTLKKEGNIQDGCFQSQNRLPNSIDLLKDTKIVLTRCVKSKLSADSENCGTMIPDVCQQSKPSSNVQKQEGLGDTQTPKGQSWRGHFTPKGSTHLVWETDIDADLKERNNGPWTHHINEVNNETWTHHNISEDIDSLSDSVFLPNEENSNLHGNRNINANAVTDCSSNREDCLIENKKSPEIINSVREVEKGVSECSCTDTSSHVSLYISNELPARSRRPLVFSSGSSQTSNIVPDSPRPSLNSSLTPEEYKLTDDFSDSDDEEIMENGATTDAADSKKPEAKLASEPNSSAQMMEENRTKSNKTSVKATLSDSLLIADRSNNQQFLVKEKNDLVFSNQKNKTLENPKPREFRSSRRKTAPVPQSIALYLDGERQRTRTHNRLLGDLIRKNHDRQLLIQM